MSTSWPSKASGRKSKASTGDRLERRQTETEVRLATEIVGVAFAVNEVRDLLKESRLDRDRRDD